MGGFHAAAAESGLKCAFACDIDPVAREVYESNFGVRPSGDVKRIEDPSSIPDHDVLFAGLPCQPFSIIGDRGGMADPRGTLFFDVARIVREKRPAVVVIENVKQFTTIQGGLALRCVTEELGSLGYGVDWRILNALDFGLPQRRERVFIVAAKGMRRRGFPWPGGGVPMTPLSDILEEDPGRECFATERIRRARSDAHTAKVAPAVWHENKGGNVSSHPFSCALRASASYNYLLVDGKRRFTKRELLRLQGFPEAYRMDAPITTVRRLTGNAVAVPVVAAVVNQLLKLAESPRARLARVDRDK